MQTPIPLRNPVEVVVILDKFVAGLSKVIIVDIAEVAQHPGTGVVVVFQGKYLCVQLPRVELVTHLAVGGQVLLDNGVMGVGPRIRVLTMLPTGY